MRLDAQLRGAYDGALDAPRELTLALALPRLASVASHDADRKPSDDTTSFAPDNESAVTMGTSAIKSIGAGGGGGDDDDLDDLEAEIARELAED